MGNRREYFTDDNLGKQKKRCFTFDAVSGVADEEIKIIENQTENSTIVHLDDFNTRYRDHSRKTAKAIANSIVEHCLWYFIREGSAPLMTVHDDGESISLQELFDEHMNSSAVSELITIKEQSFALLHVKLRSNSISTHTIALCADNRLVTEEKIAGKIPGLHGKISDRDGEFIYSCYVSSSFLDKYARPERTGFEIMENIEGLFEKTEISLRDIRDAVVEKAKGQLSEYLVKNKKRARERIEGFVAKKPRVTARFSIEFQRKNLI